MPELPDKSCLIAVDTPGEPVLLPLSLPAGATVAAALAAAREQLRELPVDWERGATGIWGIRCERAAVPREGDRIELYRPLPADPRQRRRQRAQLKRPVR
ncbi:MAG TPA: RnfH family protein [Steroidobacteraceae bacterium]|nr:RnfH family protein [Steroidobacteraceae bacterium]